MSEELTHIQSKMARVGIGLGVRDLAKLADVSPNTITRFERGESLHGRTIRAIKDALENQGAVFTEDGAVKIEDNNK